MNETQRLDRAQVPDKLDWKWSWYGLAFGDIPFVAVPGLVLLAAAVIFETSTAWAFIGVASTAVALVVLKWRKPPDYLECLIHVALAPRRLSHKERDMGLRPFPLDRELRPR